MNTDTLYIRFLARKPYDLVWQAMRAFTEKRDEETIDEIWLLEHDPVFTQGQNGNPLHVLNAGAIPIIKSDRGGQVTYHGPGQLMFYTLIDIKRRKLTIRDFVCHLEKAVIAYLNTFNVQAFGKRDAPGVYLKNALDQDEKICSIGLRVKRGATYHGIAFNVAMDLSPFSRINPCGFEGLKMTQLQHIAPDQQIDIQAAGLELTKYLSQQLGYTSQQFFNDHLR